MNDITVVIPICAMPSHPDTEVLDQTMASIREQLPNSEIILMFDGVNPNLMHLKEQYDQYTEKMLWRINHEMKNVVPLVFSEHKHQSLMLKEAMKLIRTPLMLWSEQDTPLHGQIPFAGLAEVVRSGYANLIRFHHEASIHEEHQYLMLDKDPQLILGMPLIRQKQWSGRPHLASTKFYQEIIDKYWTEKPEFIEHRMYGIVVEGDYDEFRMHIYAPEGTLVRSKHLDGRRYKAENYDPSTS